MKLHNSCFCKPILICGLIFFNIQCLIAQIVRTKEDSLSDTPPTNTSSIACALDGMNVFYIGVDNPITIAVSDAQPDKVKVTGEGCTLTPTGIGKYNVVVRAVGTATITVSGNETTQIFRFRCKMLPNPVAQLTGKKGGVMTGTQFCSQPGIIAVLENVDFEVRCSIQSYSIIRKGRDGNNSIAWVVGGIFDERAQRLIQAAQSGDAYHFTDIKARCPGDVVARNLESFWFYVK
jgi:hypothetical protein